MTNDTINGTADHTSPTDAAMSVVSGLCLSLLYATFNITVSKISFLLFLWLFVIEDVMYDYCRLFIMSGKKLSLETRVKITTLAEEGVGQREIARRLQISRGGVQAALRRFKKTGSNHDLPKNTKKRVTSPRDDRLMQRMCEKNRRLTAVEVAADFNSGRQKKISVATVKRRLSEVGLNGRRPRKVPLLSRRNIRMRLEWARKHRHWTAADWEKVVWSDESNIEVIHKINPKRYIFSLKIGFS